MTSVTIPNSVTSIGNSTFKGCSNLTKLVYYARNATVSTDISSLSFPTTIQTLEIGDGVESIPAYFVYNNDCLTSITIPSSVTSIGDYAFKGYQGEYITFKSTYVPTIGGDAIPLPVTIIVPYEAYGLYKTALNDYTIKAEYSSTCATPVITQSDNGFTFSCETEGVNYSVENKVNYYEMNADGTGITYCPMLYIYVYAKKADYNRSEPAVIKVPITSGGDINADGVVNVADVSALVKKILGK